MNKHTADMIRDVAFLVAIAALVTVPIIVTSLNKDCETKKEHPQNDQ